MKKLRHRGKIASFIIVVMLLILGNTQSPAIFPTRNVLRYNVDQWWHKQFGEPKDTGVGSVAGCVNGSDQAIADGYVLFAQRNGALHQARTDAQGCYRLENLPTGRYNPVVAAHGWGDTTQGLTIQANQQAVFNPILKPYFAPIVEPPSQFEIGQPITLSVDLPQPSIAVRRDLRIWSAGKPHQQTILYTPITTTTVLPTILAVYPGQADTWETVSIPLAARGYTVLAIGPEYTMDFEGDIVELKRLLALVRGGSLPFTDGSRLSILGGSYSSLHVLRLLRDDVGFRGVVLLGPISNIFAMRERFTMQGFIPPYGLDQALIALGYPNVETQRYALYSAQFHLRPDLPPILLMHSNHDEIIPAEQSHELVNELEHLHVPIESYFFDGMAHYLQTNEASPELDKLYGLVLNFLANVTN